MPLFAVPVLPLPAGATAASTLKCGSVITASVSLSSDLDCTAQKSGNALTIGAADVTVNLNGHTITVTANVTAIQDTRFSHLTVENGTIEGSTSFYSVTGIDIGGATKPNGDQVTIDRTAIRHVTLINRGIALDHALDSYIANNSLSFVSVGGDTHDVIADNHVTVQAGSYGADVEYTTNEVIRGNTFVGVGGDYAIGIFDLSSTGQVTTHNVLNGLYAGIVESDIDGVVSYNSGVHDARGISEEGGVGIEYIGNHFDWGRYGIYLYDPSGTLLTGNVTNHNTVAGVYVRVAGNYCGSDGFPCSATLINNIANNNARGLYSQITTSGYGNRAANNRIVDCHKVICVRTSR